MYYSITIPGKVILCKAEGLKKGAAIPGRPTDLREVYPASHSP